MDGEGGGLFHAMPSMPCNPESIALYLLPKRFMNPSGIVITGLGSMVGYIVGRVGKP